MRVAAYVLPVLFAVVFLFAAVRRVKVYDSFASGAGEALPLVRSLFPYIAAVLILAELFEASGLSLKLQQALAPALAALGIPAQLAPLVLVKPFSGSGSVAVLSQILAEYGADSYIGCCASVLCSYILPSLREGRVKRVLFAATGALLSPTSTQQGESIPSIAHAVCLTSRKEDLPWN